MIFLRTNEINFLKSRYFGHIPLEPVTGVYGGTLYCWKNSLCKYFEEVVQNYYRQGQEILGIKFLTWSIYDTTLGIPLSSAHAKKSRACVLLFQVSKDFLCVIHTIPDRGQCAYRHAKAN